MTFGRVLAIDPGSRRTGIALSDPSGRLASPLETVELPLGKLVAHIEALAQEHEVNVVLVGLPDLPSGEKGEIASLSEEIARRLRQRISADVLLRDETLTSWEAESILGGKVRRTKGAVDQLAAALLLQDYLDARRRDGPADKD